MAKTIQEAMFEKGLVSQTQFLNSQNEKLLKYHSQFRIVEETGGKANFNPHEVKPLKHGLVRSIYEKK